MFRIYRKVLLLGQHHLSCLVLFDATPFDLRVVPNVRLMTRVVNHVRDALLTRSDRHLVRPVLLALLDSKEILHKGARYQLLIRRMPNEYDVSVAKRIQCVPERLTDRSLTTRSALFLYLWPLRSMASAANS